MSMLRDVIQKLGLWPAKKPNRKQRIFRHRGIWCVRYPTGEIYPFTDGELGNYLRQWKIKPKEDA